MTLRLLVVDDEVLVVRTLGRMLSREYEVDGETSGRAALERFERGERWDAILIDVVLPDFDGRELYRCIAKIDDAQGRRVVFMTATSADETTQSLVASGRVGWLRKPFSTEALRAELGRLPERVASAAAPPAEE